MPARNTISTRLNELAKKPGTFDKLPDGSYQKRGGMNLRRLVDNDGQFDNLLATSEAATDDAEQPNER